MRPWAELRADEVKAIDPSVCVAVLPVAAVEQHGPHLPLGTDAFILEGVLRRVGARTEGAAGAGFFQLPLQAIGHSPEHTAFPGTLHQPAEVLLRQWTAIGRSLARAGVRKLLILNSHGGQPQIVDLVAIRLRTQERMLVGRCGTFQLGVPAGLFGSDELRFGMHGGEVETSMMLALRPDLVRMEVAEHFVSRASTMGDRYRLLGAEEPVGFAWAAQDLHPAGVTGNAAAADADRGSLALDYLAERVHDVLLDLAAFPLADLSDPAP